MARSGTQSTTFSAQTLGKLKTVIMTGDVSPFLVKLHRPSWTRTELKVHVARDAIKDCTAFSISPGVVKRDILRRARELGLGVSIRVKFHSRYALDSAPSLEQFIAKFGPGERICDPTGVFAEAERLVDFARELRSRLEDDVKGIYWSSRNRTSYVLLNQKRFVDGHLRREDLKAAERSIINAFEATNGHGLVGRVDDAVSCALSDQFDASAWGRVRLCFVLPAVPLVPIDKASFRLPYGSGLAISRLVRLIGIARIPILSALLGVSSIGVATAQLPKIENSLMPNEPDAVIAASRVAMNDTGNRQSRGDMAASPFSGVSDLFPGGPGLHFLWRDPINGPVSQNFPSNQTLPAAVLREPIAEVLAGELDIRWLADNERVPRNGPGASGGIALLEPGITAITGLSKLTWSDPIDEGKVLEYLQLYFGLPQALQRAAHFGDSLDSSSPLQQGLGFSPIEGLMALGESYWERLRRLEPRGYYYQRHFDEAAKPRRGYRGSSA